MSTIDDLKTRRSVRKFKDEQLKKEDLDVILESGTYAPSGLGKQSAKILVIQDRETIERFAKWNKSYFPEEIKKLRGDINPMFNAPTLVIVIADSTIPTYIEDGTLVIGNILNAAHSIGVGGCWIHRAREEIDSLQGQELLKLLGIDSKYRGIGHVVLGYPADDFEPVETPRKDDYITFINDI